MLQCPSCSRLYSPRDLGYEPGDSIRCDCGVTISVPYPVHEGGEVAVRCVYGGEVGLKAGLPRSRCVDGQHEVGLLGRIGGHTPGGPQMRPHEFSGGAVLVDQFGFGTKFGRGKLDELFSS